MRRFLFILWMTILYSLAKAGAQISPVHYGSVGDQLTNLNVTSFVRDQEGFLWMGTNRGLNRYNGSVYHQFLHTDSFSLINDNIHSLLIDTENRLWIGTDGGADMYDINNGQFHHLSSGNFDPVYCIRELDDQHLIYSHLTGLSLLNKKSLTVVNSFRNREINLAKEILITSKGQIWVASPSSPYIYIMDKELKLLYKLPLHEKTRVINLNESPDGFVWIATTEGMVCYDSKSFVEKEVPASLKELIEKKKILFMTYGDNEYQLLLGIRDSGLYTFDPLTENINQILPQKRFGSVDNCHCYVDPDQTIWLAPYNKGFRVFPIEYTFENHYVHDAVKGEPIKYMGLYDEEHIWLSTEQQIALFHVERKEATLMTPDHFSPFTTILHTLINPGREMWIATNDHVLNYYSIKKNRPVLQKSYPFNESILLVWQDQKYNCWVQLETQLVRISANREEITYYKTSVNYNFRHVSYQSPTEAIYLFSFNKGIFEFTNEQEFIPFPETISNPSCILKDKSGLIWIGSFNAGLYSYDPVSRKTEHYDIHKGLPDNCIMSILEDQNGHMWICAKNGVFRFSKQQQYFTSFAYDNFIRDARFELGCAVKMSDGTLCFGSNNGISMIYPDQQEGQVTSIPLHIDEILVNKEITDRHQKELRLKHNENFLTIHYSGLDLVTGFLLNYTYKMDGYDKEWIYAGQNRQANYSNLPAGKYTFRIKVQDANGFWSEEEFVLPVHIKPAWWYSVPAIVIYCMILAVFIYVLLSLYIRWRVDQKRLEFVEREKRMNEQLNRSKIEFFTNISHEFRTPLSLIYGPLKQLLRKKKADEEESKLLGLMERNSERLLQLTEHLLRFDKIENQQEHLKVISGDLVPLLRSVYENFNLIASQKDITLSLDTPEKLEGYFDMEKIEKILFNLLSNAVKYTPEKGLIHISVFADTEEGNIRIAVADTGCGIPEEKLDKLFERYERLDADKKHPETNGFGIGLNYSQLLVKLHRGTIDVVPNKPQGTCFNITLPYRKEAYPAEEILSGTEFFYPYVNQPVLQSHEENTEVPKESTILIVEDNPDVRIYLHELLSGSYHILSAQDGEEAMEILKLNTPDLIISDVVMPRKNGFDLCREIKNNKEYCHLPVVLLTAKSDTVYTLQGLSIGADAYISKPFDPLYLKAVVENILTNRKRLQHIIVTLTSETLNREIPEELGLLPQDRKFLEKIYCLMDENFSDENYNILSLSREMGVSRSSLYSKIKALTGQSPQSFFMTYKLNKAMELLRTGEQSVSEVCFQVGFGSLAGFSRSFKRQFGIPPSSAMPDYSDRPAFTGKTASIEE